MRLGAAPGLHGAGRRRADADGCFARVRVEDYGPGRIRPHERTHPGPKEDRLRLTRATRANLSPSSPCSPTPTGPSGATGATAADEPFAGPTDAATALALGRPRAHRELQMALADAELLIADGHHRYETARVYADEVGGEGEHRYVLMLLCSLSDPGLLVFPTHRLLTGLKDDRAKQEAIRETAQRDFEWRSSAAAAERSRRRTAEVAFGYMDIFHKRPYRVTLKDQAIADRALEACRTPTGGSTPRCSRRSCCADALGMSEDDISHLRGLDYSKTSTTRSSAVEPGGPTPASSCGHPGRAGARGGRGGRVDAAQVDLLLPKVPTGLVFNPRVKIYTRKGDDGTTGLWYGGRVPKFAGRPEAYGSIDEAGSALGLAGPPPSATASCTPTSCGSRASCSWRAPSWPPRPSAPSGWRRACRRSPRTWSSGWRRTSTATWSGSSCRPSS